MDEAQTRAPRHAILLALRDALQHAPAALLGATLGYMLQGAMPAAQVLVIAWLTRTLAHSQASLASAAPIVLIATLIIAFTATLSRIAARLGEHLQNTMRYGYRCQLATTIASMPPAQLADAVRMNQIAASQRAIYQLGYLPENILAVTTAVCAALSLSLVVWQINALAGVLVLLTLFPTLIGFRAIARVSNTVWPQVSVYERRGNYAMQQLTDLRPATELATLGTAQHVAVVVARWEQAQVALLQSMIHSAIGIECLIGLITSALLGAALTALVIGGAAPGELAAAVLGILTGLTAVRGLGAGLGQLMLDAPRLLEFHALLQYGRHCPAQKVRSQATQISVRNLTVSYPGCELPALCDVSLDVQPGEMVALVGVNGAGKTTCVNALLGLLTAQQGVVLIDGQDVCQMTDTQRLSYFSLMTQEFGRYELTVRENLLLAAPQLEADDAALWSALSHARAEHFVRALPEGLDSQLGAQWGGAGLSGGQWQRLSLARVYLRNAGIWILDEPTSAIDAEAEREVFADLLANRQQRTTIVVSHRAWTLRGMDRIYVFDQGRIVEQGSYEQLMAARGHFFALFAAQHGED